MKKKIIIICIFLLFVLILSGAITHEISSQIEQQGGLGKSIGRFINDITTEANKK